MEWHAGRGRMEINGTGLEWQSVGPGPDAGPVIVVLHEGLGSLSLWRDFPQRLAEASGMGVFAYSRAGYGGSDACALPRPLDYMTREAMDVLPRVLDMIGAQSVILMGHSDGASIAAIYAGSSTDYRVRGLVLEAPHFFVEKMGLASIRAAREAYETGDLKPRLARHHADVETAFRGWNDAWLHPDFAGWDISEVIDYLRVPSLAIQGSADQYGTMRQIEELEERSYAPVDRLIVEGAGHAPHAEAAEQVLQAVSEFAKRLARIEQASPVMA